MGLLSPGQRAALVLAAVIAASGLHWADAGHQPGVPFHRRRRHNVPGFTVRIGGTLGLSGKYRVISMHAYQGLKLFEEVANNNTLFKTSSGNPIRVSFDLQDDRSEASEVEDIYTRMVNNRQYDAFVGPYSSGLSLIASKITNRSGKLMMLHQASSPSVYSQGFQRLFSVNVMATDYAAGALRLLYARGARTVSLAQGSSLFHAAICAGAKYHAELLGYEVLTEVSIAETDITSGIKTTAKKSPDVFVGCGHLDNAIRVTVTSRALMFNPKAMIIVQAVGDDYMSVVQAPNANYIMGPVTWDRSLPQGCDVFGSAESFFQQYVQRWNMEPTYHAAQAAAAGIALLKAFQSLDRKSPPEVVSRVLQNGIFRTLVGDLNFSMTDGTRYGGMGFSKQFQPIEGNITMMERYTYVEARLVQDASELVYPLPSWEQKELEIYPCPLGYVLSETSQGRTCEVCPVGYYRNKASLICRMCPNGRYGLEPGLGECERCSTGIDCEGARQTGRLIAVPGWHLMPSSNLFMQCSPPEVCLRANQCVSMQKGILCSQCSEGYTNTGPWASDSVMCHKCPGFLWELAGFVVLAIAAQVLLLVVLHSHQMSATSLTALHTVILRIVLNYFTFTAAIVAALDDLNLKAYSGPRMILAFFLDPLSHFFSLECLLSLSGQRPFQVKIVVGILLVPALLILSFAAVMTRELIPLLYRNAVEQADQVLTPDGENSVELGDTRSSRRTSRRGSTHSRGSLASRTSRASKTSVGELDDWDLKQSGDDPIVADTFVEDPADSSGQVRIHEEAGPPQAPSGLKRFDHVLDHVKKLLIRRWIIWVFLIYPIIVYMLLSGAMCEQKDKLRLRSSLDVVCQSSEHIQWFRLSVFGLMMYGIGLPCLLFFQLFRVRHQLLDVTVRQNYGFLSNGFEPRFYYFEIIYLVRKLAVLSAVAVPHTDLRLLIMLGIGLIFMGLHIRFEPYDDRDFFVLDRLECLNIVAFLASCIAGLWFDYLARMRSSLTTFSRIMESEVVDWIVASVVICIHAAFLGLAIWSLIRNLFIKQLRFLEECFPEHLSPVQRCLLRLAEKQWHHVKMDPDTHELDISQLSKDERLFLYAALCDTMAAYVAAAVRPTEVPHEEKKQDAVPQDGQQAVRTPDGHTFYVGFMIAALRRAYKRVEHSRYKRAVHYLQALEEEELDREKAGWFKRKFRKFRFLRAGGSTYMEARSSDDRLTSASMPERQHSDGVAGTRTAGSMAAENSFASLGLGRAMAWLKKSYIVSSANSMGKGTAEQRAAASIRKLGVTVEELHLALMLSWPDIAEGKEEYFVLETDEDRERAFRREVLRAEGTTWREDESVKKLFKSIELRRRLKPCSGDESDQPESSPPSEVADDALPGPGVEELLGLQPAAKEQASCKALRQEHQELLVNVLELRSKVRSLERRLQVAGEPAGTEEQVSRPARPCDSPEIPVALPFGVEAGGKGAAASPDQVLGDAAAPAATEADPPVSIPALLGELAVATSASADSSQPEPPSKAGATGPAFSSILSPGEESNADGVPAEPPPAIVPDGPWTTRETPFGVELVPPEATSPSEAPADARQPPSAPSLPTPPATPATTAEASSTVAAEAAEGSAEAPASESKPEAAASTGPPPQDATPGEVEQLAHLPADNAPPQLQSSTDGLVVQI